MVYNCKILRTKCVLAGGGSYRQNGRKSKKKNYLENRKCQTWKRGICPFEPSPLAAPCITEGGHRTTLNLARHLYGLLSTWKKNLTTLKKILNILNKICPIKNKIWLLQNFGSLKINKKNCEKCYVHNMFSILL